MQLPQDRSNVRILSLSTNLLDVDHVQLCVVSVQHSLQVVGSKDLFQWWNNNNRGPSTEPCGTPNYKGWGLDEYFPVDTKYRRWWKNEAIQSNTVSGKPKRWWNRQNKKSWSIVSNAAEKSSTITRASLPVSIDLSRSFWTSNRAVSVLWDFLYPDWSLSHHFHRPAIL